MEYDNKWFIDKSKIIHGDKYDYSLVNYKKLRTKVKIICPIHGAFDQTPEKHFLNRGCPYCSKTKNILKLSFDFYLPKHNVCVEYDGIQHFESIKYFGGDKKLKNTKINDEIKTKFCVENNIKLIRIKYTDNIFKKLKEELVYIF